MRLPRIVRVQPSLLRRLKYGVYAAINDGGMQDVNDLYRAAAPAMVSIDYDRFIPSYAGHEALYRPDGIHLTEAQFHRFGAFVGTQAAGLRPAAP